MRGAWFAKTTGISLVGCPDIIACYKGRFLAFEVKRERDGAYGATTKQLHELSRIEKADGISLVVWDVEQVRLVLDDIDSDRTRS
jgi:Holliday junction resolvase